MEYLLRKNSLIFLLCATVFWCWLYFGFIFNKAHIEVGLEVSRNSTFEIFWAKQGKGYTADKKSHLFVHPGLKNYSFFLTDLSDIERLRIDPVACPGEVKLLYLNIRQPGFAPIQLSGLSGLEKLKPCSQVEGIRLDTSGMTFQTLGGDPGFELYLQFEKEAFARMGEAAGLPLLIAGSWIAGIFCSSLLIRHRYVLLLLAGAWVLVWVMAVTSSQNSHPDEYVHSAAINYYQQNWLPPRYEDVSIRDTYSPYGNSRLNYYEIYYPVAGKIQQLLSHVSVAGPVDTRLFNVLLFGAILLFAIPSPQIRMLAAPFLLSPQIWYLFSYSNSEAFALFVCFVASCELTCARSPFHRYLKTTSTPQLVLLALYLGCLVGVLLLVKKNYYPFVGFALVFIVLKYLVPSDSAVRKGLIFRLLAIGLIGAALFAGRIGADYSVNGADKTKKLAAVKEATAHYRYKPSTPPDKRIFSISPKKRGMGFRRMISKSPWYEKTFRSGFGVYGYSTIYGSNTYYEVIKTVVSALLLFFLFSVVFSGTPGDRLLVLSMLVLSAATVFASLYHSWTVDFQPQGRYLMAIVPMLGLLYANSVRSVNRTVVSAGTLVVYCLGVYSFICYGLVQIAKTVP